MREIINEWGLNSSFVILFNFCKLYDVFSKVGNGCFVFNYKTLMYDFVLTYYTYRITTGGTNFVYILKADLGIIIWF